MGELLRVLEFAYNSTVHPSTKTAPSELLYGLPGKPICKKLRPMTFASMQVLPLKAQLQVRLARQELRKAQEFRRP